MTEQTSSDEDLIMQMYNSPKRYSDSNLSNNGISKTEIVLDWLNERDQSRMIDGPMYLHSTEMWQIGEKRPIIDTSDILTAFDWLEAKGYLNYVQVECVHDSDKQLIAHEDQELHAALLGLYGILPDDPKANEKLELIMEQELHLHVQLAPDFTKKYTMFKQRSKDPNHNILYRLHFNSNIDGQLCINDWEVRKLQSEMTPRRILERALESNDSRWVDITDLIKRQDPAAMLNSIFKKSPHLRRMFIPKTQPTKIYIRPVITKKDIKEGVIDETLLKDLLRGYCRKISIS